MSYLCTIHRIPDVIAEGSEYDRLNTRFPHATKVDGVNAAFCMTLSDAVNPILIDCDPEDLLVTVAGLLLADDRSRAIHIDNNQLQTVFDSPQYQLFAGNFEKLEDLQALYKAVFEVDLVGDMETAKAMARQSVSDYFQP